MSYYILPKINTFLNVIPEDDVNDCPIYISFSLYNFYNNIKIQIETICLQETNSFNSYEEIIKLVNPYEYIFSKVPGSKFSVSKLKPISPTFYDFLEIFLTFNILDSFKSKSIKSLHVSSNFNDTNYCIEMLRENFIDDIFFNFNEINEEINKTINNSKIDIMIFNIVHTNINSYVINLIKTVMLILRFQSFSGTSIIKIEYIFHKPIIDLIYLLCSLFDKVYIIKPNSSNITTYEKYIVCKNFNIINDDKLEIYKNNYHKLNNFIQQLNNTNIQSIIDIEIPYYFINKLDDINIIIGQQQLESLDQVINIFKNKNREDKIENIKKSNIQKSVSWCEKFKIPCNRFTEKTNIFLPIIKETKEPIKINNENILIDDIENIEDIENVYSIM